MVEDDVRRRCVGGDLFDRLGADYGGCYGGSGQQPGKRNLVRPKSPLKAEVLDLATDLQLRFREPAASEAHITVGLPL